MSAIEWILEYVDYVLIMSVNPGFSGQVFIPNSVEKIKALRSIIENQGLSTRIEIDGGVNEETIAQISQAGADVFVAGSAIFGSPDYRKTINNFRKRIDTSQ